ncbi:MAG: hypothetical protein KF716_09900 [Anaerolineae bacterium]|nr:hypothetical protein [Anaerolineae bacterium]
MTILNALEPRGEQPSVGSPPSYRRLLMVALTFVVVFVAVRVAIRPINDTDYQIYRDGLEHFWQGQSPYPVTGYVLPPWATVILAPLVNQPLEVWLALTVTIFVVSVLDQGSPVALLLLLHPIFLTLIASSNPEWIFIGTGVWLLEATPRGVGRGVAWVFLASKPQTIWLLLVFDGIVALRQRDWKPFVVAGGWAVIAYLITPMPPQIWIQRGTTGLNWSLPIVYNYGVIGALLVTAFILVVRWQRRNDYKTLGLLLSLVWTPYVLQYAFTTLLFAMRKASWLRILVFLAGGIGLAYLFWRDFHVNEQAGAAGMLLLAAIMAPSNVRDPRGTQPGTPAFSLSAAAATLRRRLTPHPHADRGTRTV